MDEEGHAAIMEDLLYWISDWWNSGDFTERLIAKFVGKLTQDELVELENHIRNTIWPEAEIDFQDRILEYIDEVIRPNSGMDDE